MFTRTELIAAARVGLAVAAGAVATLSASSRSEPPDT
jgi:hypothetical protein